MSKKMYFTSESVTEGHPDKICDCVSDAILDELLKQDEMSRVACETTATTGIITVMGEITTNANIDYQKIVRDTVKEIGYDDARYGFDGNTCAVVNMLHSQSPDISMGVDKSLEVRSGQESDGMDYGAGDQGMMFGYACTDTPELMPMPISLAHKLAKRLTEVRRNGTMPYLRPDGKTQVTVLYEDGKPKEVDTVVVSSQHSEDVEMEKLRKEITENVIYKIIPEEMRSPKMKIFVNPTGRFVVGGPMGDSGLTGRKIIVDTYGGWSRHGGGAFSGKDPTKVDRTAAYAARYLAKNVVKSGLAEKCEVQIAYAIGVAKPVSLMVETFGTGKADDEIIASALTSLVDLRPKAIIEKFRLRRAIYRKLAAYGQMGREDDEYLWEKTDIADSLKIKVLGK